MAESSSEKPQPSASKLKKITEFAKNATIAVGLVTAGDKAVDIKNDPHLVVDAGSTLAGSAHGAGHEVLKKSADLMKTARDTDSATSRLEISSLGENGENVDVVTNTLYGWTKDDPGRGELEKQIQITQQYMNGVLTEQSYKNLKEKESLIVSEALKNGIDPLAMIGLACTESRGGVDGGLEHRTDAAAMGWYMITDDLGRELGLNITNDENDDRLKPDVVIPIVAKELGSRYQYFGDLSLALWSWHMGAGGVENRLEEYAQAHNLVFDRANVRKFVEDNKINVFKVLNVDEIREMLEGDPDNWNKTEIFLLRIAGSALNWKNIQEFDVLHSDGTKETKIAIFPGEDSLKKAA